MIVFIPNSPPDSPGGLYVNLKHAKVVAKGGYGRIEFELSPSEIAELTQLDPETPVHGDEADLVFNDGGPNFIDYIKSLAPASNVPDVSSWLYWCAVDEKNKPVMYW